MIPRQPTAARERRRLIALLSARLKRQENPRLAMLAVLTGAGLGGFLGSVVLLELGVASMALRYALAALAGYGFFLLGLRLWLALRGSHPEHWGDAISPDFPVPGSDIPAAPGFEFGGGGGFSGGGAGGSFDPSPGAPVAEVAEPSGGGGLDLVPDVDEGLLYLAPIAIAVLLIGGLVGSVAILVGAPALLAEVLLDVLIAGAAYRRLRHMPSRHWLHGAVRRTWLPFAALLIAVSLFGWVAQSLGPNIQSVGDLFRD